jgi:hypothetical protein
MDVERGKSVLPQVVFWVWQLDWSVVARSVGGRHPSFGRAFGPIRKLIPVSDASVTRLAQTAVVLHIDGFEISLVNDVPGADRGAL